MSERCIGCGSGIGPDEEYALQLKEGSFQVTDNPHNPDANPPMPTFIRAPFAEVDTLFYTGKMLACRDCAIDIFKHLEYYTEEEAKHA